MFGFFGKVSSFVGRASPILQRYVVQNPSRFPSLRYISSERTNNKSSFTLSYLINSCGLSPASALLASKRVHFETPDKPDKFLSFLKSQGFTQTQISRIIKACPHLLVSKLEKTILPKFDFFRSQGFSSSDVVKVLNCCPALCARNLETRIVPSFKFFKGLFPSEEKARKSIKRYSHVLKLNPETELAPKISFLRDIGLPDSCIVHLLRYNSIMIVKYWEKLKNSVEEARGMGFNPSGFQFVEALIVLVGTTKSTWERKVNVYKRWGWSEDDILVAFRKYPKVMLTSENKITAVMDLFVNKLGWESSIIASRPLLLAYSVEKRLFPRGSILQYLQSKNLVKKGFREFKLFECSETRFLQNFVNRYVEAPELLKIYGEKLSHLDNKDVKESAKI